MNRPHPAFALSPWMILLLSLVVTIASWQFMLQDERLQAKERFVSETEGIKSNIRNRLLTYEQTLQSGVGLFNASEFVSREEWRVFVASMAITKHFPGIQGYGWSLFINPGELEQHIATIRAEGFPDYTVRPGGERERYTSIVYLEPFDKRNQRAFGFDMFSEPMRRAAMERARDDNQAALSGKVTLVQENDSEIQAGCLLYLPVYKRDLPINTREERRAAIIGFVYAPFRMNDLMEGILGTKFNQISLRIYDGDNRDSDSLMYASHRKIPPELLVSNYTRSDEMVVAGHTWMLDFQGTAEFANTVDRYKTDNVLVTGFLFSLLLFALFFNLSRSRTRAQMLAQRMTEDLSASEIRTRAILDTAVNAIVTMGVDRLIRSFNPAAQDIFGYSEEEVLGKNVNILMPEPFHSQHDGFIERYLRTGENHIIRVGGREVMGKRKQGETFPLWLAVGEAYIDEERLFVGCIVDITERKRAEQSMIDAKEAAEAANRAKSDFLNTMSHELRTPLTVILGYMPLLTNVAGRLPAAKKLVVALADRPEATEFGKLVEQINKMAGEMKRNGEHLFTLINDLLDISKIEAGKLTLNRALFDVEPLTKEVLNSLRMKAEEKRLRLVHDGVPVQVFADEVRLKQILINLIGNAVKFTDQGEIRLTVAGDGAWVVFSVTDTGPGIEEDEVERIFERFHQIDNTSTRKAGGTGLGLAITKKLIEISGGTITVSSIPGQGATFRFTMPAQESY